MNDKLNLSHWVKQKEADDAYPFANFHDETEVITYNDQEYKTIVEIMSSNIGNSNSRWCDWTKVETDLLMDLCKRFNLNFIVISDRF